MKYSVDFALESEADTIRRRSTVLVRFGVALEELDCHKNDGKWHAQCNNDGRGGFDYVNDKRG